MPSTKITEFDMEGGISAVKRVQSGFVHPSTDKDGVEATNLSGGNFDAYHDILIEEVSSTDKCQVRVDVFILGSTNIYSYIGKLVNTTTLRVYFSKATSESASILNSYGYRWEVTEFY